MTDSGATDGLSLTTPLASVNGVGPARAMTLRKLGLRTARDVLFLFPRQHEYPPPPIRIDELKEGQPATLTGEITDAELMSRRPGRCIFAAIVENETGAVRILFFNQPFRADHLTVGRRVRISGTPKLNGLRFEITHPKLVFLEPDEDDDESGGGRILPVYPLTEGIRQLDLRRLTGWLTEVLAGELAEVMPESLRRDAAVRLTQSGVFADADTPPAVLPAIDAALRGLHQPQTADEVVAAQTRFIFQELLVMQLALAMRRHGLTSTLRSPPIESTPLICSRIIRRFPFELTADQKRVIDGIAKDMSRQFPMNRLLQGDVGSGKTIVAIFAMLLAVASGHQATLMAPTEVLARQHHATLTAILRDSRVRVGLLCGSLSAAQRRQTLADVAAGQIDLLVGTQALLFDVTFASLALCVIDEQHKFGVRQRIGLRSGGVDPHYLVMSATPIPRSVAMTQFGDVDLSTLRDKPAGRGVVNTYLADDHWQKRWWDFVGQRIREGRQAFVVAPRVGAEAEQAGEDVAQAAEDAEQAVAPETDASVTSVTSVYNDLTRGPLADFRVALLHGRMPAEEKQRIMSEFADGEIDVLVSTTVIEVGIDVANATVMTILGAQRFGLAQLHQLRGRVSRGVHAGHVCVFTDGEKSPRDDARLQVFESTSDGFELAEADFRLRGPGDVLGQRQSGLPPLRIADLTRDVDILAVARDMARELIDANPELDGDDWRALRQQVLARYGKRLDLGDGA